MGSYDDLEWDDRKDVVNREKHGLPLIAAAAVLDNVDCMIWPSDKSNVSEARSIAIGPLRGRLITCIFVARGDVRRVISIRYASRKERRAYQEAQKR